MKAAIYSPYLDTLGGGERYMMTIAETLAKSHQVDILLDSHLYLLDIEKIIRDLSSRFGLDLKKINFIRAPLGKESNTLERSIFLIRYDLLVYLTDGSIFYPTSTKNILHIQSPIIGQPAKSLWGKLKLNGWDLIMYNSYFTKKNSELNWPIKSEVVYPPVDTHNIKPLKKKKNILSVGRFFGYLKDKKQELLIKVFDSLYKEGLKDWSLHLVGSAGEGDKKYIEELKDLSKGIPVKFHPNLSYEDLIVLYGESSIYWHAAGFEEENPTKMEHFGISTVEAMAAGCVPVVIKAGGQVEIVEDGRTGFLWDSLDDLEKLTLKVVSDIDLRSQLSKQAIEKAKMFSKERFTQKIIELVKN